MSTIGLITGGNRYYTNTQSPYWAYTSIWGTPAGTAFDVAIVETTPWPNATTIAFAFPSSGSPSGIWAYPAINIGATAANNWYEADQTPYCGVHIGCPAPPPKPINQLNLSVSWSVTLDSDLPDNYDVIFDAYTTVGPPAGNLTKQNIEVSVWVYVPPGMRDGFSNPSQQQFLYTSNVTLGPVYNRVGSNQYNWIPGGGTWQQLDGSVDFGALLREAADHGILPDTDWLNGMSLGPEVILGTGSIVVNQLQYQWS